MYEIEKKNNRFIVWRYEGKRKLRQGSFATEEEAHNRIAASKINRGHL